MTPYSEIHRRVAPAVTEYHKHTTIVQRFIQQHGHRIEGWETWDVAPFHVLNARRGEPVPQGILGALDAAIGGRSGVNDEFTEANINPKIFMDASDITHRVFVEKLRTLRRIWFPHVPEKAGATPGNAVQASSASGLTIIQTSTDASDPTKAGVFSALAGDPDGSNFYKVSFDVPVEMTIVSGSSKRNFEIGLGHIKLKPCGARPAASIPTRPRAMIPTLQQTATDVAAAVGSHMRREVYLPGSRRPKRAKTGASVIQKTRKKMEQKKPVMNVRVTTRTRVMTTRSMARSARSRVSKSETVEISDDDEDEEDGELAEPMDHPSQANPAPSDRANPFAISQRTSSAPSPDPQARSNFTAVVIPAFAEDRTEWIVDVSSFGDVTFYDPSGKSPITYIEEDDAKKKLQELIFQLQPMVVNVKHNGQIHQLSPAAVQMLAVDKSENIAGIVPQLVAVK